jgi:hypothetical protein
VKRLREEFRVGERRVSTLRTKTRSRGPGLRADGCARNELPLSELPGMTASSAAAASVQSK